MNKTVSSIILAAGKGNRMKSDLPKVLHEIAGETAIEKVLKSASSVSFGGVVVTGHEAELVEKKTALPSNFQFSRQGDRKGTAIAVQAGIDKFAESNLPSDATVLILPADMPLIKPDLLSRFLLSHEKNSNDLTVLVAKVDDALNYGRVIFDEEISFENHETGNKTHAITGIVEFKDASSSQRLIKTINSGVYAIKFSLLQQLLPKIDNNNEQNEFYFTDIVALCRASSRKVEAKIISEKEDVNQIGGFNNLVELAALREIRRDEINNEHRLNGVDIFDSASTWIDENVEIGQGTSIIGAAIIRPFVKIGKNCSIGPWTFLRSGTELEDGVKVGGFSEVKNAHIGKDSKVPHLSYVGDAEIGERTNLGAGTIFANYNGQSKSRTKVGSDCKIGSNTVLVAPVEVGDKVYTGASTLVRENIESGSLAVSENRLRTFEDWFEANRG